jgi:hypothetical protein
LRRKEQLAQEKVVKISQELSNKDRVMKSQLEEKDREIKRLKSAGDKAERVKGHRESMLATRRPMTTDHPNTSAISRKGILPKSDQLSPEQITQLQGWLAREVDDQALRITLAEDIKIQNEERALCNKRLALLKQLRERESNPSTTVASRSEEETQREIDIKHLEVSSRFYDDLMAGCRRI